jgi:predicted nucleic acid-binding protein
MPYFTYDTSVVIARGPNNLRPAANLLLSTVVLMEVMASARDDSLRKVYENLFRTHEDNNSLIVPHDIDWLFGGKILFWLSQARRRFEGGRLRRLPPGASQRMAMDVLLATSARRQEAAIVTYNWNDFKAIQRFCNVKIIKASDFFK